MSDSFQPVTGKLGQLIRDSSESANGLRLEFFVEIEFGEVEFDGETETPLLRVDGIDVEAKSWRDLENTTHEFPYAPRIGSVDAGMILFGCRNPADVIRVAFGVIDGNRVPVTFDTEVDFEIEAGRDDLEQVGIDFVDFPLEISPLRIGTSLAKRCEDDPEKIADAITAVVSRDDYGPVEAVPGGFELSIAGG